MCSHAHFHGILHIPVFFSKINQRYAFYSSWIEINKWKLMFSASSEQRSRIFLFGIAHNHVDQTWHLFERATICKSFQLSFLCLFCLRATQNKALSFLRAALIPTAGVVERCELPALTFPACPRSPLKPLGPSFVLSAGAKPRAQSCFESAGWLESAAHSQWKGTVRQKFGCTFWFWFTSYVASNSEGVKWQDLWRQRKHNIIIQNMHFSNILKSLHLKRVWVSYTFVSYMYVYNNVSARNCNANMLRI